MREGREGERRGDRRCGRKGAKMHLFSLASFYVRYNKGHNSCSRELIAREEARPWATLGSK
jgi:hypothetical protein